MCLTCDVKVAGTGACKAVLNICQASSAPRFEESRVVGVHLSIDRRVSNWKSTFFSIVRCRIAKKYLEKLWCEISEYFRSIVITIFDEFRVYLCIVICYILCIRWKINFILYSFFFFFFISIARNLKYLLDEKTFRIKKFTAYILDYQLLVYVWQLFIQCLTRKHFIYLKTGWHFDI